MTATLVPRTGRFPLPRPLVDFDREFDEMISRFLRPTDRSSLTEAFVPHLNLAESENDFEVTVNLPEMKAEDFNVELHDGNLCISGEPTSEAEEKGKTYHRVEPRYGSFRRVIPLVNVDPNGISAEYTNGVLRVTAAKSEAVRPKRIKVKA